MNGDGFDDVIVGAWKADPGGRSDAGESYVVFGFSTNDVTVNREPVAAGSDALIRAETPVPLADLFTWSDPDGAGDIVSFAVRDRTDGGGYLTKDGTRQSDGLLFDDQPIGDIDRWAFVAGAAGEVDEIGFNVIDASGAFNTPSATATVTVNSKPTVSVEIAGETTTRASLPSYETLTHVVVSETFTPGEIIPLSTFLSVSDPDGAADIEIFYWNDPVFYRTDLPVVLLRGEVTYTGPGLNASFNDDQSSEFVSATLNDWAVIAGVDGQSHNFMVFVKDRSDAYSNIVSVEFSVANGPNLNEAPSLNLLQPLAVAEGETFVYDFDATDDNDAEGDGLTYSIDGGADALRFNLDPVTGVLTFKNPANPTADSDADATYEVSARVTDRGGLSASEALQIVVETTVTDDRPPVPSYVLEYFAKETAYADATGLQILQNVGDSGPINSFLEGWTVQNVFGFDTFRAVVLEHSEFAPVLSIRGSTGVPFIGDDWFENFRPNGVGLTEFKDAAINTGLGDWLQDPENRGASITGHSQGGAIAQYAVIEAVKNNIAPSKLVTFNTAGISLESLNAVSPSVFESIDVQHYISHGDIVSLTGNTIAPTKNSKLFYYDFPVTDDFGIFKTIESTHSNHWYHNELNTLVSSELRRSADELTYPNMNVRLVGSAPSLDDFLRPDFSLLDTVGDADDDFGARIQPFIDFLRNGFDSLAPAIAVLENSSLSLPEFPTALPVMRELSIVVESISAATELTDASGEEIADLVEKFFERGNLENFRGSVAYLILSAMEIGRDLNEIAKTIGFAGSDLILDARDFSSAIIKGFLETTIAIGDILLSAVEELGDVGGGLLNTLSTFAESVGWQSQIAAPIVAVDDEFIRKDIFGVNDALILVKQTGAEVKAEFGQNFIVGNIESLNGSIVQRFGINDLLFVKSVQIAQDQLGSKKGSAILTFDEDQDGVDDLTITLEGNYRLESFDVEVVEDGTIIRYLGNAIPIANPDEFEISESNIALIGDVLLNDIDGDGDLLNIVAVDVEGTIGLVSMSGGGTFEYDQNDAYKNLGEGQTATDRFAYLVSDGVETARGDVRITIVGVNDVPVLGDIGRFTVFENVSDVGAITASDVEGDALGYRIVGGSDLDLFELNGATGVLSFKAPPDFEEPGDADRNNTYDIEIEVSDGKGGVTAAAVNVIVDPVNEAPVFDFGSEFQVLEGGDVVGVVSTDDEDSPLVTFSLDAGDDAALFEINRSSGQVSFLTPPNFSNPQDVDRDNIYELTVVADDGDGGVTRQPIAVTVGAVIRDPISVAIFDTRLRRAGRRHRRRGPAPDRRPAGGTPDALGRGGRGRRARRPRGQHAAQVDRRGIRLRQTRERHAIRALRRQERRFRGVPVARGRRLPLRGRGLFRRAGHGRASGLLRFRVHRRRGGQCGSGRAGRLRDGGRGRVRLDRRARPGHGSRRGSSAGPGPRRRARARNRARQPRRDDPLHARRRLLRGRQLRIRHRGRPRRLDRDHARRLGVAGAGRPRGGGRFREPRSGRIGPHRRALQRPGRRRRHARHRERHRRRLRNGGAPGREGGIPARPGRTGGLPRRQLHLHGAGSLGPDLHRDRHPGARLSRDVRGDRGQDRLAGRRTAGRRDGSIWSSPAATTTWRSAAATAPGSSSRMWRSRPARSSAPRS